MVCELDLIGGLYLRIALHGVRADCWQAFRDVGQGDLEQYPTLRFCRTRRMKHQHVWDFRNVRHKSRPRNTRCSTQAVPSSKYRAMITGLRHKQCRIQRRQQHSERPRLCTILPLRTPRSLFLLTFFTCSRLRTRHCHTSLARLARAVPSR